MGVEGSPGVDPNDKGTVTDERVTEATVSAAGQGCRRGRKDWDQGVRPLWGTEHDGFRDWGQLSKLGPVYQQNNICFDMHNDDS